MSWTSLSARKWSADLCSHSWALPFTLLLHADVSTNSVERRILSLCVSCRRPLCSAARGCRYLPPGVSAREPAQPVARASALLWTSAWAAPAPCCHFWRPQTATTVVCLPLCTRVRGSLGRQPALGHPGHGACAHPQPHGQPQAVLGGSVAAHAPPRAGRPVTPRSHQP